jgi:hypothetical protein
MKMRYLLLSLVLGAALPGFSQTMSNTDHVITLTNTCITAGMSSGTYNLELNYYDLDFGPKTVTINGVTVAISGNVMTITAPANSYPTASSNGYWSLPDTYNGHIGLTSGTFGTIMYWYQNPDGTLGFNCVPLPIYYNSFSAWQSGGQVTLNWQTGLEQNSTFIEIYRTSSLSNQFYKIGQVTAAGNSSGNVNYSFVDTHPCSNDIYMLKMLNSQGTQPIFSGYATASCPGCSCTLPAPVNCNITINGPDHICNVESPAAYSLSAAVPNFSTITWGVNVPASVRILTHDDFDRGKVTLLKKNTAGASLQLTATMSGCSNVISKYITIGTPNPNISATEVCPDMYVYASNCPGATQFDWHFTDETISYSWVLTNYVPGWNGTFTVGDVYDIGFTYDNICGTSTSADLYGLTCDPGEGFRMSPNPSNGMVMLDLTPASDKPAAVASAAVRPGAVESATAGSATAGTATVKPDAKVRVKTPAALSGVYQVRIIDALGAVRKQFTYHGETKVTLDVSGLAKGIYTVQVFDNKTWRSSKLVLTK